MNIAIIGYGKMGKMIQDIANNRGHKDVRVFDPSIGKPLKHRELENINVAIEFSTPESAPQNYLTCFQAGVPVVSGTTGWLKRWDEICKAALSANTGFFYSSNFSLGVNLFFKLNTMLARIMAVTVPDMPSAIVRHLAKRRYLLSVSCGMNRRTKSVVTTVDIECILLSIVDMAAANTPAITSPAKPSGICRAMNNANIWSGFSRETKRCGLAL